MWLIGKNEAYSGVFACWVDGWMEGWMEGWYGRVKDCLQQLKTLNKRKRQCAFVKFFKLIFVSVVVFIH